MSRCITFWAYEGVEPFAKATSAGTARPSISLCLIGGVRGFSAGGSSEVLLMDCALLGRERSSTLGIFSVREVPCHASGHGKTPLTVNCQEFRMEGSAFVTSRGFRGHSAPPLKSALFLATFKPH